MCNFKKYKLQIFTLIGVLLFSFSAFAQNKHKIGFSIGANALTKKKLQQISDAGIDCIETGLTAYINKDSLTFTLPEADMMKKMREIKQAANETGVEIWSIHMPYGKEIDISFLEGARRQKVIAFHQQVLKYVAILKPKVILFHPSYYLALNQREMRIQQLVKSVQELNKAVKAIKAVMVVENMLGPALLVSKGNQERPLLRTVEECLSIFKLLPDDVYAAVDLNHIAKPEQLLLALGSRVKTLHVADGDGKAERHYFPCDGKGENDWKAIFKALQTINYKGPFMYESNTKELVGYRACYNELSAL
ncbi:sugar phosphate isomerase/epimerase family protein [Pedobacter sp. SL55]|uniref:sugar phosphate isomerase/epimerase family protein n=1 Tax=Pedobacter sp. SL55 TaxID=2995161 RepID=UPI00226EDF4C|nr:sugar phosphate isomerase/epimerase family protein [Pedobacter sp. SL55]WAC40060.1 sugar phosphate isomerase/epimerase [Pedobacter sp. SL55]